MKKICSLLLAIVMIAATFAVISIPTAAVEGEWKVYTAKSQYLEGYNGVMHHIAGYKYTEEGFTIVPPSEADAAKTTPYVTAQTANEVDLRQGVYMEVRIDEFTYAGDTWFSFHAWDSENIEPGKQGENYGYGVETLIKIKAQAEEYSATDKNTYAGALTGVHWYSDIEEGVRTNHGSQYSTGNKSEDKTNNDGYIYREDFNTFDEDGKPIFVLEIVWRSDSLALGNPDGIPEMYINGAKAPDDFNLKMADCFKSKDYMAHIGFSLQSSKLGGEGAFTILKFGTSEDDAKTPVGEDNADPEIVDLAFMDATIADKSEVSAGEPAIILTGDAESSNAKGLPSAYNGNILTVKEDGSVNVKGTSTGAATISLRVQDDVAYSIKDFPISLVVLRNFCTCEAGVDNATGDLVVNCKCEEQIDVFGFAGDVVDADQNHMFKTMTNEDPENPGITLFKDEKTNTNYICFMANWLGDDPEKAAMDGRIHGLRIDFQDLQIKDEGRDNFDVCMVGFFENTDDAKAYAKEYVKSISDAELSTQPESNTETEETTEEKTEEETEEETEAKVETTAETKTEAQTEAKVENNGDDNANEGGCGGTIGFGALAIVALAGAGLVSFRKKED